jgi:hypothetical protein
MRDFIKETLEDPKTFGNFKITSYKESTYAYMKGTWYGKAQDRTGMTVIGWATDGHGVTYFGKKLEKNITVTIGKDGDTRTAFNGYCFNREDFEKALNLTW